MLANFLKNQSGAVSPQFAIMISAIFLSIGGGVYLSGDDALRMFNSFMNSIRHAL